MSGENQLQEIVYEGYGPGGVAIIVHTITDNKNRTASNMRHIFTKYGGDMGQTGSVSWIFKRKGVIIVDAEKYNYDTVESLVFETSAEDIELDGTTVSITTSPEDLLDITSTLQEKDIRPEMSELEYIAENDIEITDFEKVLKLTKMLEAFDEDEDVESVSSNEEISEELQTEVDEFIEKNTFRT
ncbi:MAG: YebC/PmpR family DNA-binding transcriptional regulator [Candidatus Peribacteria bacterium]|nr:MAG: YebC/PmpR family DNA-binding transcriptional regulator [Candidatus Peribacteria bacterium]